MRQLRFVTCVVALSLIGFLPGCDNGSDGTDGGGTDGGDGADSGNGDGGDMVDAGFDGGGGGACTGPMTGPCNVFDLSSCGSGMACVLNGDGMGGVTTRCIAIGIGGRGSDCDAATATGCQDGFQCDDGTCKAICCTNSDCVTGDFCGPISMADAGYCTTPVICDPIAQTGCDAGFACYPTGGGLVCDSPGTLGEGELCMSRSDCAPGMGCISTMMADGACRAWCDTADPDSCPMDFACTGVTGLPVGACTPAMAGP